MYKLIYYHGAGEGYPSCSHSKSIEDGGVEDDKTDCSRPAPLVSNERASKHCKEISPALKFVKIWNYIGS